MIDDDGLIRSTGDAERVAHVCTVLVYRLLVDPRVEAILDRWRADAPPSRPFTRAEDLRAQLDVFIRTELQLPYPWLADQMTKVCALTWLALATGATPETVPVNVIRPAPELLTLPPGRMPKQDRSYLARDVDWMYRANIQQPPESIRSLARAYAKAAGRRTNAKSVVQNGIRRVRRLLSTATIPFDVGPVAARPK